MSVSLWASGSGTGNSCDPTHSCHGLWFFALANWNITTDFWKCHSAYTRLITILMSIINSCRSGKVVNLDLLLIFGNEITPGDHPLFMTECGQLTSHSLCCLCKTVQNSVVLKTHKAEIKYHHIVSLLQHAKHKILVQITLPPHSYCKLCLFVTNSSMSMSH